MNITMHKVTPGDPWVSGETDSGDVFHAKLFNGGSVFGINDGRVSKFSLFHKQKLAINYDRGWDIEPPAHLTDTFKAIINHLENLPWHL